MRPRADPRRAQATVEWLALVLVMAVAAGGIAAALRTGDAVGAIAKAIDHRPAHSPAAEGAVTAAVSGTTGAISLHGAEAWLAETIGPEAAGTEIDRAIVAHVTAHHQNWLADRVLERAPSRGTNHHVIVHGVGAVTVHRVTPAAERAYSEQQPRWRARAEAGGVALAWNGASRVARALARPLGLMVRALRVATKLATNRAAQPAGTRADDIVLCRPVVLTLATGTHVAKRPITHAWRVGVLRHDVIILDLIADDASACTSPPAR